MNELQILNKLKPIKPDVAVETTNHFLIIIILSLIIAILIVFFIFYFKNLKIKKEKKELLNLINNPKKFAYEFSKKAKKYKNKKNEALLEEILNRLTNYKYKKKVENLDKDTLNLIKQYLGVK